MAGRTSSGRATKCSSYTTRHALPVRSPASLNSPAAGLAAPPAAVYGSGSSEAIASLVAHTSHLCSYEQDRRPTREGPLLLQMLFPLPKLLPAQ
eukprot:scaffold208427_cov15-Tisochrysis_lutea.AAC.1